MPKELTIQDVERLVDKFKIERYTYLILIAACAIIILVVAVISFINGDWKTALSLMAPGGTIFFCLSRVFKIWDDIMNAFFNLNKKNDE
ncbi:hypothetical protein [Mariniflexile sp. AS56]|uniref:hypothetical protein n=1 Tax=Mariniflexile sp. AS56 TaxID=3063957 RepID=UPI0026EE92CA|nr:hypothetical protein [Mariniflexile sp. AS56]MDO7171235.1 hypothetical protein [Mariniflexile sp. AS56]